MVTGTTRVARPMERLLYEVKKVIVGQDDLLEKMVVALLARGHLLVEGVPGLAKTMTIKTLAAGRRRHVPAHPVHARPGARRPRGHPRLQPEDRRVQHLAGARLREPAPGRRDQPRAGQGPERPARGHAGAAGHDRARDPSGAPALPRPGHAEPHRDRGHVRAARGAGRPLHAQGPRRLPLPDRGVRHRRAHDRPAAAGPDGAHDERPRWRSRRASTASTSTRPSTSTRCAWRRRPERRASSGWPTWSATSRSAPARGRRSTSS